MEKPFFTEEQKNDSWWFRIIMAGTWLVSVIPVCVSAFQELQKDNGDKELLYVALFTTIFVSVMIWFVSSFRLKTKIDSSGVYIQFFPKMRKWKLIPRETIVRYEVKEFRPFREFGGWGAKKSWRKQSQAYTISGRTGIRLFLTTGKEVLIGTQQKQSAIYALRKLMQNE